MRYKETYNKWLTFDGDTKRELLSIKDNEKEIEDRFYKDLEFGTAGLRGLVEAGTNRMNIYTVRKTSHGLAKYFLKNKTSKKEKAVVIAHDNRNMSREFCMEAAKTMASNGIKVYYFDSLRTTPMLSYSVLKLNCMGGIMITASHNPPEYNGYKVYGDNGAQIMPNVADQVLSEIRKIKDFSEIPKFKKDDEERLILLDEKIDREFLDAVEKNTLRKNVIRKYAKDFKVVYTPLCGTGLMPVVNVLKDSGFENIILVEEEANPDPNFAGIKTPNPEEARALKRGINLMKEKDADILIATDPDCDRVGVAVKNLEGEVILLTGNQIGGLLTDYVIKGLKENNSLYKDACMMKTIVTSEFGADIAKDYNVEVENFLTGFKFIGDRINQYEEDKSHTFVLGYEESYGYLIGKQCRDKDAVVATLMISEMALYYKSQKKTLYEALIDLYEKYGYYKEKTISISLEGKKGSEKIVEIMQYLREKEFNQILDTQVLKYEDYKKGIEGFPKADVIKYYLEDKSWLAFRPSGTEPKIKIYIASYDKKENIAQKKLEDLEKYFLELIKSI